ncbi:hypothetical protein MW871_15935 [Flavobacterium sp. I-SCBP12n]|uniref:Uncharacterized protein n=1 Tax=Flavobacterium pygoscelis TaxID=2893176 RepID=A0A9X2BPQ3_9FLAO|nr:hypothetical protein [Flavobacterium pygoscelis]MCK8143320.1 hypothetical protein [Flavobacterium pygoscelis]MCK8143382.1 hypothetical protein [Flavobacterium pygoscelis]
MTSEKIIEIVIEVILFLVASYFIFYKSWLTSLGNEIAKLSTIEELTKLTENVKADFSEKMETYKSKLSEELTIKIEPLKSELAKNNITHQIQFSFLHEERGKVILELYKKLIELHSAMVDWTNFLHPVYQDAKKESQDRSTRADKAITDFKNFYLHNKLFFSKNFCKYIDEIFKEYWEKGWDFGYNQQKVRSGELTSEYHKLYSEQMSTISKELKENLPVKIAEIEDKFRKILNVEEEE